MRPAGRDDAGGELGAGAGLPPTRHSRGDGESMLTSRFTRLFGSTASAEVHCLPRRPGLEPAEVHCSRHPDLIRDPASSLFATAETAIATAFFCKQGYDRSAFDLGGRAARCYISAGTAHGGEALPEPARECNNITCVVYA